MRLLIVSFQSLHNFFTLSILLKFSFIWELICNFLLIKLFIFIRNFKKMKNVMWKLLYVYVLSKREIVSFIKSTRLFYSSGDRKRCTRGAHLFVPFDSRLRRSFGFIIGKCANRVLHLSHTRARHHDASFYLIVLLFHSSCFIIRHHWARVLIPKSDGVADK